MNKLYKENKLYFALVWIGIYCIANSIGNLLSDLIGVDSIVTFGINAILSVIILTWIKNNELKKEYGLCKSDVPAYKFIWYIPLAILVSQNIWLGFSINMPTIGIICYILNMIGVGFLEEIIFRGFLFKALEKDDVKMAMIVSSVTFGIGHILNLFNGSGMGFIANLCQVVGAIACGFLFVIIFHRGGSLIPCIVTHIANNAINGFANEAVMTDEKRLIMSAITLIIVLTYTLILLKTLPQKE